MKKLRLGRSYTQHFLADKADVGRRYLQDLEAGRKHPTVIVASRLKKALKCDWKELLRGL